MRNALEALWEEIVAIAERSNDLVVTGQYYASERAADVVVQNAIDLAALAQAASVLARRGPSP
ncbi:MAG: hypothetical protein ABW199_09895 [Caulobacterales bacterium]